MSKTTASKLNDINDTNYINEHTTDPSGTGAINIFNLYRDQIIEKYPNYYYQKYKSDIISYDKFLDECLSEPIIKEIYGPYGSEEDIFIVYIELFPP